MEIQLQIPCDLGIAPPVRVGFLEEGAVGVEPGGGPAFAAERDPVGLEVGVRGGDAVVGGCVVGVEEFGGLEHVAEEVVGGEV